MVGERFGNWTVVAEAADYIAPGTGKRHKQLLCRCICGTEKTVKRYTVQSGASKSCGCTMKVHGHRRSGDGKETPTHRIWRCMKERCQNPNHVAYARYGGRGITVCDRWQEFANFLADMGERPEGMTIDREDNDRGYEPGNCRWTDNKTQQRNTISNRLVKVNGRQVSVAEAAESVGLDRNIVYKRLDKGWPIEKALSSIDHRTRDRRALG